MPYNDAQVRLFQMVKHGKAHKKGMSARTASKMLSEAGQSHDSGHPRTAAKKLSRK